MTDKIDRETGLAINKKGNGLTSTQKAQLANVESKLLQQGRGVELYITEQGHISNVCRHLNIDRSTWYRWMNDKRFNLAIQQADKALDDTVEQVMSQILFFTINPLEMKPR